MPLNPLDDGHYDAVNRVCTSCPQTAAYLDTLHQVIGDDPTIAAHIEDLRQKNATQHNIMQNVKRTFFPHRA